MDQVTGAGMIIDLHTASREIRCCAAEMLHRVFTSMGIPAWDTADKAHQEVSECLSSSYAALGYAEGETLFGWIGARPMYGQVTWELHPLVVDDAWQGKGVGRALVLALEARLADAGAVNMVLGSDDETGATSLYGKDFTREPLFPALEQIQNLSRHPFGFYQKMGYRIVGVIPDAEGLGKHDILMWKRIRRGGTA